MAGDNFMCAKFDQNRRGSIISLVDFIWNDPVSNRVLNGKQSNVKNTWNK